MNPFWIGCLGALLVFDIMYVAVLMPWSCGCSDLAGAWGYVSTDPVFAAFLLIPPAWLAFQVVGILVRFARENLTCRDALEEQ